METVILFFFLSVAFLERKIKGRLRHRALLLEGTSVTCSASLFHDGIGQLTFANTHDSGSVSESWLAELPNLNIFLVIKKHISIFIIQKYPNMWKSGWLGHQSTCTGEYLDLLTAKVLAMQSGGELHCWIYQDLLPTETKSLCMELRYPGSSGQLAVDDRSGV